MPINIYLDLSKAFDTIDHFILIDKLKYYGISEASSLLLKNYLADRKQCTEINNVRSNTLSITTGVPQGSILGSLLFILYINDFPQASNLFDFIMYADDTTLSSNLNKLSNNEHDQDLKLYYALARPLHQFYNMGALQLLSSAYIPYGEQALVN